MQILITRDVAEFVLRAELFLAERLERNVLATLAQLMLSAGPHAGAEAPIYALGVDPANDAVVAAAMRTPPRHLISSGFEAPAAATQLMAAWLEVDPGINGLSAEPAEAASLITAWIELTHGETKLEFSEALHQLENVATPARLASGSLRQATQADEELLVQWTVEFVSETGFGDLASAAAGAKRTLAAGRSYFWEDKAPVMMLGHATRVGDVNRVGPVYTPPVNRGRGYASAAVAALSQKLLAEGARRCMLFTDLSNLTSNKIYEAIGYRRFADWEEHRFLPHSGARSS